MKTADGEKAIVRLAAKTQGGFDSRRMTRLLTRFDQVPNRRNAFDPLARDRQGLPK